MIKKFLTTLLLLSCINANATEDAINHKLEYGIVDLDTAFMSRYQLSHWPSLLKFQYYFSDISSQRIPYGLSAELSRISSIEANLFFYFAAVYNVSGQYYFNEDYDIEYSIYFNSHGDKRETLGSFTLNKMMNAHWTLGGGIYMRAGKKVDDFSMTEESYSIRNVVSLLKVKYQNIVNNEGWFNTLFLSAGDEDSFKSLSLRAERFHSIGSSTQLSFGYESEQKQYYKEISLSYGISQKYWFSANTAIDVGISMKTTKEKHHDEYSASNDTNLIDLNFTSRF